MFKKKSMNCSFFLRLDGNRQLLDGNQWQLRNGQPSEDNWQQLEEHHFLTKKLLSSKKKFLCARQ